MPSSRQEEVGDLSWSDLEPWGDEQGCGQSCPALNPGFPASNIHQQAPPSSPKGSRAGPRLLSALGGLAGILQMQPMS